MDVHVRQVGPVTVLDLSGKVTLGLGDKALRQKMRELLEGPPRRILVNLERVPYMDSSGLGELIRCRKLAQETGSTVKLLNPAKRVYDLLHVVKLDQVFECYSDEARAVASFEPPDEG